MDGLIIPSSSPPFPHSPGLSRRLALVLVGIWFGLGVPDRHPPAVQGGSQGLLEQEPRRVDLGHENVQATPVVVLRQHPIAEPPLWLGRGEAHRTDQQIVEVTTTTTTSTTTTTAGTPLHNGGFHGRQIPADGPHAGPEHEAPRHLDERRLHAILANAKGRQTHEPRDLLSGHGADHFPGAECAPACSQLDLAIAEAGNDSVDALEELPDLGLGRFGSNVNGDDLVPHVVENVFRFGPDVRVLDVQGNSEIGFDIGSNSGCGSGSRRVSPHRHGNGADLKGLAQTEVSLLLGKRHGELADVSHPSRGGVQDCHGFG
mmetsp:Transcript_1961/g.5210  ORF Transcript_1961/g.5210 Transcript_1961/m.5210 type:complete len:316 (-) Transcript_1961:70-1017(-)